MCMTRRLTEPGNEWNYKRHLDKKGYRMEDIEINIICYVDHTVLTADDDFTLQRLFHLFLSSQKYEHFKQ
jgi:hypothetical protein